MNDLGSYGDRPQSSPPRADLKGSERTQMEYIEGFVKGIEARGEKLHIQIAALVKERNALREALQDAEFALDDPADEGTPSITRALTVIRRALG